MVMRFQSPLVYDEVKENMFDISNMRKTQTTHINIVSEYDQEISQSQTADNPKAPRAALPSQTR